MNKQGGAAVVEFAVLSTVMVTLMFAIPMLGNMVDARQMSIQAGRYALWQSTVEDPNEIDAALLQQRFFADAEAPVSSDSRAADPNRLWGTNSVAPRGLAADSAIVVDESTTWMDTRLHDDHDGLVISRGVGGAIELAGDAIGTVTGREWGIGKTALTRTDVGVAVKSNAWLADADGGTGCGGFGCLTEGGAILVDGWGARDEAQAKERVQAIVPATALEPIGDVVSILGNIPVFKELGDMDGMFGHVDMRPLPEHAERGLRDYVED